MGQNIEPRFLPSPLDAGGAGGGVASGREPGPLEQEFEAVKMWLRQICPASDQYTFMGSVSAKDSGEIRNRLEIRQSGFLGAHLEPYVVIYAGEFRGETTDSRHSDALSWTLEVPRRERRRDETLEKTLSGILEFYGAEGFVFWGQGSELIMMHPATGKQLRFVDISGPSSRDINGNVYFEDIPQS